MFGRLPLIHRLVLAALAVGLCVLLGLWAGATPEVPVVPPVGLTVGLALGAALAWLVVHESTSDALPRTRRVRDHHRR